MRPFLFDSRENFRHSSTMNEDDVVIDAEASENRGRQEAEDDTDDRADAKVSKLKAELEAVRKEKQEYLDGWQRAKADYVNALRRFEEEKKTVRERGISSAVEKLLPAFDSLERAKEHGDVPEGFAAIVRQLESAFSSLGLTALGEVGEAFNPLIHEALGNDIVKENDKEDTVTVVLEKGWRRGDDVIRPAKVRVGHVSA